MDEHPRMAAAQTGRSCCETPHLCERVDVMAPGSAQPAALTQRPAPAGQIVAWVVSGFLLTTLILVTALLDAGAAAFGWWRPPTTAQLLLVPLPFVFHVAFSRFRGLGTRVEVRAMRLLVVSAGIWTGAGIAATSPHGGELLVYFAGALMLGCTGAMLVLVELSHRWGTASAPPGRHTQAAGSVADRAGGE